MPMGFTTEEFLGGPEAVKEVNSTREAYSQKETWLDRLAGAVAKVLPNAASAAKGALAQLSYSGSAGNFQTAFELITLSAKFQWIVDQAPEKIGNPLFKNRYIKDLSGFVKCEIPVFSGTIATSLEEEAVETFMSGGFFYE